MASTGSHFAGRRRLVLHFDVNSTILLADQCKGLTPEVALNCELSKTAYVQRGPDGKVSCWHDGRKFSDPSCVENPPALITDDTAEPPVWVERKLEEFYEAERPRGETFISTEEGKIYKAEFERLMAYLSWKGQYREELMMSRDGVEPKSLHFVVPALFRCIVELRRQQRDFVIVLRTFGHDLPDLQKSFESFSKGLHPDFPDFKDESMAFHGVATLRWDSDGRPLMTLPCGRKILDEEEMYNYVTTSRQTLAISDHYEFWKASKFNPSTGKPFWFDKSDNRVHHIFFDDNIHFKVDDSIVAVRARLGGTCPDAFEALSGADTLRFWRSHVIKARITSAIADDRYFLRLINEAEALFDARGPNLPPLAPARDVAPPQANGHCSDMESSFDELSNPKTSSTATKRPSSISPPSARKRPAPAS